LRGSEIMAWDSQLPYHHRSAAACQWGSVWATHEDLAAFGAAILGQELIPHSFLHRIRPPAPLLSRLRTFHKAAGHLAKTAPDILAHAGVTRAMEQALVEAMVWCLASGNPFDVRSVHRHHATVIYGGALRGDRCFVPEEPLFVADEAAKRHHARIMVRFEEVVVDHLSPPLHMQELCDLIGVSDRNPAVVLRRISRDQPQSVCAAAPLETSAHRAA
jgi:hypothetical protein